MILVILVICIIGFIASLTWFSKQDPWDNDFEFFFVAVFFTATVIVLGITIHLACSVAKLQVIDEKITMYQEENTKIEEQIAITVKEYQAYETEIFTDVKCESAVTLVALYPELKADTLVQKQLKIYVKNNDKIKDLKEDKINGKVTRWWLYFGG